jgi:hypothetical protein
MCQRCHLRVDLTMHVRNAKKNTMTVKYRVAGLTAAGTKRFLQRARERGPVGTARMTQGTPTRNKITRFHPQLRRDLADIDNLNSSVVERRNNSDLALHRPGA